MSNEAKAWANAFGWALIALLWGIWADSGAGIFFAALGIGHTGVLVYATWRDDREERGR